MKSTHVCGSIIHMNTAIIAGIAAIPLIISIVLIFIVIRLNNRLNSLSSGTNKKNLEDITRKHIETVEQCRSDIERMNSEFDQIRKDTADFIRKVGLVRYQGFKDTGGDQSFSLALLNEENSGIIITSLLGRGFSKIYAKKVTNGSPERTLTNEEERALNQALEI